MAHYSVTVVAATISLALLKAISWAGQADADPVPIVRSLVGGTVPEVVRRLGRPYLVIPLRQTGGKLMFFENSHDDYYIIETNISQQVVSAAVKHPENQ
jgi:hypothetical protein